MYNPQAANAARHYSTVQVHSNVCDATPHRLIQMLFEGALDKVVKAKSYMQHGNVSEKGSHISFAISIISGLRMSLDNERGGDIAVNLRALYDYMEQRLFEANVRNDAKALDEVAGLLRELKAGWDAIPDTVRNGQ